MKIGNDDLKLIHKKCEEFDRDMPTEMKLFYDVKKNSLKANYRYDLIYTNDDELLPDDILDCWFEEVKEVICKLDLDWLKPFKVFYFNQY